MVSACLKGNIYGCTNAYFTILFYLALIMCQALYQAGDTHHLIYFIYVSTAMSPFA